MTNWIKISPLEGLWADGRWVEAPIGFNCQQADLTYDIDKYLEEFTPDGMKIVDWTSNVARMDVF